MTITHPPIQLHPANPHYFLWRDRPTLLITSGEHYGAVLNTAFDYVTYLKTLQADGLNHTRLFTGTYREVPTSFGITENTLAPLPGHYLCPWSRSGAPGESDGGNKFDLSEWDEAYFARLRDFLRVAGECGIVVEVNLFCPFYHEDLWQANPMNVANNVNGIGDCPRTEVYTLKHADLTAVQEAVTRRVVAELAGFDNLYYEVCNEPYFGGVTLDWQRHIADVIVETERDLPHRHLISMNIANKQAKVQDPHPAVSILNFHYAYPPDAVEMNYGLNRVIGENETGFRGTADTPYRTEAWDFIIAGGGLYNNLDFSFTASHPDGTFYEATSPGGGSPALRKQLKILKDFIESFNFLGMAPDNTIIVGGRATSPLHGKPMAAHITARALVEPGMACLIYINGGDQIELLVDLPAGSCCVNWLNTKTGEIDAAETFIHPGGQRLLTSPAYEDDIAVSVTRG